MLVSDFNYHLPEELIAQSPPTDRAGARMLHLRRASATWRDLRFKDLPTLLRADDLLVMNNTRVFPARLFGKRSGSRAQRVSARNPAARDFLRGTVEVLLVRELEPLVWRALVHPGRKIGVGERVFFSEAALPFATGEAAIGPPREVARQREEGEITLEAEVVARGEFGERTLRFAPAPDFFERLERIGHVPLPPYIARPDLAADRTRYQTVYARERGAVAAPTAGLHFTAEILEQIRARGIETAEITLHVGLGTFQPIHAKKVEEHYMHGEPYEIPESASRQINQALAAGRRIVAVGTTTVRALEDAARESAPRSGAGDAASPTAKAFHGENRVLPGRREASLFIYPGFNFRAVGAMLTNFHLPQSTLLMLVSAFAGRELVLRAYEHAVAERYRFFSYGDCMLVE